MTDSGTEHRIEQAIRALEASLREHLALEAKKSVDGALQRIPMQNAPFRISDVEVDVVIRHVRFEANGHPAKQTAERAGAKRPARKRAPQSRRGEGRGRPPGPLRSALIETFAAAGGDLSIDAIRAELRSRRVSTTDENLHQQLRRLVKAGELTRAGRGLYRRTADPSR